MKHLFTILVHPKMADILTRLVQMLAEGLREIEFDVETVSTLPPGAPKRAIVLGANFFSAAELEGVSNNSIIFNVENTSSPFLNSDYKRLMRNFSVWDFSETNASLLSDLLVRPVNYLRMFYVPSLSRIPVDLDKDKDIDVLFYGSFNERREQVLNGLRERGLRVQAVYNVFGSDLDQLITRSKVIINIHFYPNGHLEMIRIFDLLANGRAVVSELNAGELIDSDLVNAFLAIPYEQLIDATEALVRDPDRRQRLARDGREALGKRSGSNILKTALSWSEAARLPADAVIGSGKKYDPKLLNIDVDARWHPDIVADISDPALFNREFASSRFGNVRLRRGYFDSITAEHVLEHVPDLVNAMRNCLELLYDGGVLRVAVPYDLSYGAWQDPTHVHAFNERSWVYYCDWCWYLGWDEARFDVVNTWFRFSAIGTTLSQQGVPTEQVLRSPRAVDEMSVVLRKRLLTEQEREYGRNMRGDNRSDSFLLESR